MDKYKKGDILRQFETTDYVVYKLLEDPYRGRYLQLCKVKLLDVGNSGSFTKNDIKNNWSIYKKHTCGSRFSNDEHFAKKVAYYKSPLYKVINGETT